MCKCSPTLALLNERSSLSRGKCEAKRQSIKGCVIRRSQNVKRKTQIVMRHSSCVAHETNWREAPAFVVREFERMLVPPLTLFVRMLQSPSLVSALLHRWCSSSYYSAWSFHQNCRDRSTFSSHPVAQACLSACTTGVRPTIPSPSRREV